MASVADVKATLKNEKKKPSKDLTQERKDASGLVVFVEASSQMVTKRLCHDLGFHFSQPCLEIV